MSQQLLDQIAVHRDLLSQECDRLKREGHDDLASVAHSALIMLEADADRQITLARESYLGRLTSVIYLLKSAAPPPCRSDR